MTNEDFWAKTFFAAQDMLQSLSREDLPMVWDAMGEPLELDRYNFVEYCARYADMCLEEYLAARERLSALSPSQETS